MVDLVGVTLRKKINAGEDIPVMTKASYWSGGPAARSTKFQNSTSAIDKALKAANFIPAFAAQVIETDGVSPSVVGGLRALSSDARHVRNGVGLWNAAQSIPKLIVRWYEFKAACMSLSLTDGKALKLDVNAKGAITMKIARNASGSVAHNVSRTEKILGVVSSASKLLEWIAFNICFIVCAPAQWLDSWFKLGPHAKTVGSQFGLVFLIKDVFLYGGVIADLARKKCELDRLHPLDTQLVSILNNNSKPRTDAENAKVNGYIKAENDYRNAKYEAAIITVKSVCDMTLGVIGVSRTKVNPWVTLSLGLASSFVGLWEIWRDTPPGETPKKEDMPQALKVTEAQIRAKGASIQAKATSVTAPAT